MADDEEVDPRKRLHDAARRLHRHEQELAKLREAKGTMAEKEYFAKLEALLVQLARVYR